MSNNTLSNYAIDHFRRQAYVVLRGAVDSTKTSECLAALQRLFEAGVPPVRRGRSGEITRLANIADRLDGRIIDALLTARVRGALRSILGPNVVIVLNRHNHAGPNRSGDASTRFHRDVLQWSRPIMTAVFYLEPAGLNDGCTWVIPGSQALPQSGIPNNGGTWLDEQLDIAAMQEFALPVPVLAGDVLLLDSLAFHSVGQNSGAGTRWSVVLGFRSVDELAAAPDSTVRLVEGQLIYRGNELLDEPSSDFRRVLPPD